MTAHHEPPTQPASRAKPGETEHMTTADIATHALAAFLLERDWPNATPRENSGRTQVYRRRAAAILNGEAWAIRETWPEAAYDIAGMRPA